MFKPVFEKRDNMPIYHYPLPVDFPQTKLFWGEHLKVERFVHAKKSNLYIHLPFCKSICNFCSFTKWVLSEEKISNYIELLKSEIEMYSKVPNIREIEFSAIYFGGGTPSLLSSEQLVDLLSIVKESFNLSEGCEITIEGNPSSFNKEKFSILKENGVTRISMGVQTFNSDLAKILGLPQEPYRTKKIIRDALDTKFDAVSIDLIYNIPTQSLDDWCKDLKTAIELGVNQLTLFPLTLAPFTKLGKQIRNGELPERLPQENEYEYYIEAVKILQDNGFNQLTNVDWLKPGSRYKYCEQHFYEQASILGLGTGAFGELNGISYINSGNLDEYKELVSKKFFPVKKIALVKDELPYQYITMGLRCLKLSDVEFKDKFGTSMFKMFEQQFEESEKEGLLEINGSNVCVTTLGAFYLYDLSRKFVSDKYNNINSFATSVEMISKN